MMFLKIQKDTNFQKFDFNHPVYILYSMIQRVHQMHCSRIWFTLIEKKELLIHCNVKKNDKVFIILQQDG